MSGKNGKQRETTNGKKTYICATWPYLAIGKRVEFKGGLFETDDPELQKIIEGNEAFGAQILVDNTRQLKKAEQLHKPAQKKSADLNVTPPMLRDGELDFP